MPFQSRRQARWMFANDPRMAKRWADHTPDMKALPEKKASVLSLAQVVIASNALELSLIGKEKQGMHSVTLAAFLDETEKIAAAQKEAGYDPVGEARGFAHIVSAANVARKAKTVSTVAAPAAKAVAQTAVSRGARAISKTAPSPARGGGLMKNLALGGAAIGGGALAAHMMPHHEQQGY